VRFLLAAALSTVLVQSGSSQPWAGADRVEYAWYESGRLASVRAFRGDKKLGRHFAWWPNGAPQLVAEHADDAFHGSYRSFYPSGRPFERRRFEHGREAGRQQSWTESGELFLNYEVRNGRRYGLVNARPCVPVGAFGSSDPGANAPHGGAARR
jgi:antitoxin component YwqK of YwqJK toxin-antitoxin module